VVQASFSRSADAVCLGRIPADIEANRWTDPARARVWRLALRHTMGAATAAGFTPRTITRDGCYVLPGAGVEGWGA
jgi:hypothetical protein